MPPEADKPGTSKAVYKIYLNDLIDRLGFLGSHDIVAAADAGNSVLFKASVVNSSSHRRRRLEFALLDEVRAPKICNNSYSLHRGHCFVPAHGASS